MALGKRIEKRGNGVKRAEWEKYGGNVLIMEFGVKSEKRLIW